MSIKIMKFSVIILICFIGLVAAIGGKEWFETSVQKTKILSPDVLQNGTKHIDNMVKDLFRNKRLNDYLHRGLKITDGQIQDCMKSHFKGKRVVMDDIEFQTRSDFCHQRTTFSKNWWDKMHKEFSFKLAIKVPTSLVSGKFDSEFKHEGSNQFKSEISVGNMKISLQIKAKEVLVPGEKVRYVDYLCEAKCEVMKIGVTFISNGSVAGKNRNSIASSVVKSSSRPSVAGKVSKTTTHDLQKLIDGTKKCVKNYIEYRFAKVVNEWCRVYINNGVLKGSHKKVNKRVIDELETILTQEPRKIKMPKINRYM